METSPSTPFQQRCLSTMLAAIGVVLLLQLAALIAPVIAEAGTLALSLDGPWNDTCSPVARSGAGPGLEALYGPCMGNGMGGFWLDNPGTSRAGDRAFWEIDAPPGITINSVWLPQIGVWGVNSNQGWGGGDYWAGGGGGWNQNTSTANGGVTRAMNSSYYGWQVVCGWSTCRNTVGIIVGGIQLTATENQGPSLTALGGNNLWYQGGRWVRNENGDGGWPIALASSDPSGVCDMWAYVNGNRVQGPTAAPDTSQWHQCPDQTWTQGAVINTRDYITGAGQLSLELDSVNAAGVTSRVAETLNVDNDPVGVLLNTPNDADTTQWVGHPVTVDAAASAGPSGVGGIVCSKDGGSNQSYPVGGVSVDGDGVHTVSCTAWNQAEGPAGSGAAGTRSVAVRIDEAPPTTQFEPQNPGDPTGLVVDTSDNESGVAGGQIEMRPASGGSWTPLATQFDGQHLLAHVDDAGLNGPYQFQATACDNVGNCSATNQQLALPLRIASSSNVSFHQIVNPLQPRLVRERVRVGWHWAKVRRHGRLVRVKRGGHLKTIKVVKLVQHCTNRRVRIARHRWRIRHTCKTPRLRLTTTQQVRFGRKVTIHGLLTTAQGIPLADVPVQIMTAPDNGLSAFAPTAAATTGPDGSWTAILPPGPSRLIRADYGGASTILPATGLAKLIVPAEVKLTSITPDRLPWGGSIRISGRVLGGYVPASSKLLRLDIGVVGLSKIQGIPDIAPDGRFTVTYTFDPGQGVVRFWFMVSTLAEADFPFAPSHSRRVSVTVGVPTPPAPPPHHNRHAHRRHHDKRRTR